MRRLWKAVLLAFCGAAGWAILLAAPASATITPYITFQGKLTNPDGTNVTDNSYTVTFSIYSVSTGGTAVWAETKSVTTSAGIFQTNLGDTTTLPGSVNFNSNSLYLGVKVGADAEMTPRVQLTSAPQAFNADNLGGISSAGFLQLSPGSQQSGFLNINGAITSGAVNGLTLTQAADGFTVAGGTTSRTLTVQGASITIGSTIQPTSSGSLSVQSNGANPLNLDVGGASNINIGTGGVSSAITIGNVSSNPNITFNGSGTFGTTTGTVSLNGNVTVASGKTLTVQGANSITVGTASANRGSIIFKNTAGANTVTLQAPAANPASSFSLTLPSALGSSGNCLTQSDGTGTLAFAACAATLQDAYNNSTSPATITTSAAAKGLKIVAGAVPTADLLAIDNSANPVTTAGVNGLSINYAGGAAAVEASGMRIDYAPGGTSGGTWSGLRIVANATGPVSGVTSYGIKLEGPTAQGAGTEEGAYIGTGWDIGIDIQSGGLQLAAQTDPATPASGNLRIYAKDIAGRILPKWIGPSGVDTPFQANLGFNRVSMIMPAGGTTLTTFVGGFGTTFTNTGTAANPTPTTTNLLTSVRRATFSTGTTAGTVASHRQSVLQVWRGNAAGRGGFFYTIRFGTDTLASGNRAFVGLADSVAAPTNVDPTTNTTPGKIGMAINTNTGNWNFVNNVTGTAPTVTALGASFPVNTTDLYELVLYSAPNGTSIGWRVTDISTGAQTSGSASTNIPAATTFLAPNFWITNNATAAAAILDFSGWYLESDN